MAPRDSSPTKTEHGGTKGEGVSKHSKVSSNNFTFPDPILEMTWTLNFVLGIQIVSRYVLYFHM